MGSVRSTSVFRPRWADWKSLAMQLFVVFIGLLGALQVDDWRQRRELAQTETVYLQRLSADLRSYIAFLNEAIPLFEEHRRAVAHVNASLAAGEILRGDTALFEQGLIFVGHLPSINRPSAAYDEMVASGVFARLRSPEVQRVVSELYATQAAVDANFGWWREQPIQLETALQPFVEYYSDDTQRVPSTSFAVGTEGRRIRYVFQQLRSQPAIRNGFYWAEDTHGDWVDWSRKLLDMAVSADALVTAELKSR
jgi:hypothetical protein